MVCSPSLELKISPYPLILVSSIWTFLGLSTSLHTVPTPIPPFLPPFLPKRSIPLVTRNLNFFLRQCYVQGPVIQTSTRTLRRKVSSKVDYVDQEPGVKTHRFSQEGRDQIVDPENLFLSSTRGVQKEVQGGCSGICFLQKR